MLQASRGFDTPLDLDMHDAANFVEVADLRRRGEDEGRGVRCT